MPRGKPFVCWLDNIALYIGDDVMYNLDGNWIRGKIGRSKYSWGGYVVWVGRKIYRLYMTTELRPVLEQGCTK